MPRPAFHRSAARPSVQAAEGEARRLWAGLLERLGDHARRVLADAPVSRAEWAALAHEVSRMRALFPIRQACVAQVSVAVMALARGFVEATGAEDRLEMAGLIAPLVAHLDDKLVEQGHALARVSRRWAGDTD